MFHNLRNLLKYRGLIQSLVVRDLKARYRGSVLGFFWSFVNPLLLLLIYTFVFTVVLPGTHTKDLEPYALFMFCGILPWTWFSSSLLEASTVLISGGNLIKKVLFPAEVLPDKVTVLVRLADKPEDIDAAKQEADRQAAERELQKAGNVEDAERARIAMLTAMMKLRVVERIRMKRGI
jgi:hypothetical protein